MRIGGRGETLVGGDCNIITDLNTFECVGNEVAVRGSDAFVKNESANMKDADTKNKLQGKENNGSDKNAKNSERPNWYALATMVGDYDLWGGHFGDTFLWYVFHDIIIAFLKRMC